MQPLCNRLTAERAISKLNDIREPPSKNDHQRATIRERPSTNHHQRATNSRRGEHETLSSREAHTLIDMFSKAEETTVSFAAVILRWKQPDYSPSSQIWQVDAIINDSQVTNRNLRNMKIHVHRLQSWIELLLLDLLVGLDSIADLAMAFSLSLLDRSNTIMFINKVTLSSTNNRSS